MSFFLLRLLTELWSRQALRTVCMQVATSFLFARETVTLCLRFFTAASLQYMKLNLETTPETLVMRQRNCMRSSAASSTASAQAQKDRRVIPW